MKLVAEARSPGRIIRRSVFLIGLTLTAPTLAAPSGAPGHFPDTAEIQPGRGIGDLAFGDSMDAVTKAWGKPRDILPYPYPQWTYGTAAHVSAVVIGFEKDRRITGFAVNGPEVSLKGAPDVKVGAPRKSITQHLGKSDPGGDNTELNYDKSGLTFEMNVSTDRCTAIFVSKPGHLHGR